MLRRVQPLLAGLVVAAFLAATTSCALQDATPPQDGPLISDSLTRIDTCSTSSGNASQKFLASAAFRNTSSLSIEITGLDLTRPRHLDTAQELYLGSRFTTDLARVPIEPNDDSVLFRTWKDRKTLKSVRIMPGGVVQVGVVVTLLAAARTGTAGPLRVSYVSDGRRYTEVGTFNYTVTVDECPG